MEDRQLIEEFVAKKSEAAFGALVDRYINLVHSAATRQVHDAQLAQEVTQAVFILLARKIGELPAKTLLPGWLYRTTRFVAARAVRAEQRRHHREQEAFEMQQLSSPDPTWQRMALRATAWISRRSKRVIFFSRNNFVQADGEEHTITLHQQLHVSGVVKDAVSKQPIASFKAIPG